MLEVHRAVHEGFGGELEHVLLEAADEHELAPHVLEKLRIGRVPVLFGGVDSSTPGIWQQLTAFGHSHLLSDRSQDIGSNFALQVAMFRP